MTWINKVKKSNLVYDALLVLEIPVATDNFKKSELQCNKSQLMSQVSYRNATHANKRSHLAASVLPHWVYKLDTPSNATAFQLSANLSFLLYISYIFFQQVWQRRLSSQISCIPYFSPHPSPSMKTELVKRGHISKNFVSKERLRDCWFSVF